MGGGRRAGARGALVAGANLRCPTVTGEPLARGPHGPAWIFAAADPLAALQSLATANRRALGAQVLGVTGSVGKTSVKDIARTLLPGASTPTRRTSTPRSGCR